MSTSKKQRADDTRWIKRALGKEQSDRYGNKLYRKECEAGNKLTFTPKAGTPAADPQAGRFNRWD